LNFFAQTADYAVKESQLNGITEQLLNSKITLQLQQIWCSDIIKFFIFGH